MTAEEILASEPFRKCASFHGHVCPGLAIGFRAAQSGLAQLQAKRAADEEIVAIVENSSCSADAIQVLTGCTFGKGNFIFKDYGKQVFILLSRGQKRAIRVSLKAEALKSKPEENQDRISVEEKKRRKTLEVLGKPEAELFNILEIEIPFPPEARILISELCDRCQEPTMPTRLKEHDGQRLCGDCREALGILPTPCEA